jgi:hypothetical protein
MQSDSMIERRALARDAVQELKTVLRRPELVGKRRGPAQDGPPRSELSEPSGKPLSSSAAPLASVPADLVVTPSIAPGISAPAPVIAVHGVGNFEYGDVVSKIAGTPQFSKHNDFRRQTLFLGNARFTLLEDDTRLTDQKSAPRFLEVNWSDVRKPLSSIMGLLRNFLMVVFALLKIGESGVEASRSLDGELRTAPLVKFFMTLLIWASLLPMLSAILWKVDVDSRFGISVALGLAVFYAAWLMRNISQPLTIGGIVFGLVCMVLGWFACFGVQRELATAATGMAMQVLDQPGRDMVSTMAGAVHSWVVLITAVVFMVAAAEVLFFLKCEEGLRPSLTQRLSRLGCLWLPIVLIMLVQPLTVSSVLLSMTDKQQEVWGKVFESGMAFHPRVGQLTGGAMAGLLLLTLGIGALQYKLVSWRGRTGPMLLSGGLGLLLLGISWVLDRNTGLNCHCCVRYTWLSFVGLMLVVSGIVTYLFYRAPFQLRSDGRPPSPVLQVWHPSGGVARKWVTFMLLIYPIALAVGVGMLYWHVLLDPAMIQELISGYATCALQGREVHADQAYLQSTKYAAVLLPLASKPFATLLDSLGDVFYFVVKRSSPLQTRDDTVPRLARAMENMMHHSDSKHVVILAHSQGTVISATLLDEVAEELEGSGYRVTLLTVGSPITSLYKNFFDVHIGQAYAALCKAKPAQFAWVNICRRSDYIGSSVKLAGITNLALHTKGDHLNYWGDKALLKHLAAISAGITPPVQDEIVVW